MSDGPQIVLGVSGSIAAYKAAEIVRLMVTRGWGVSVMMTEAATRYVGPLTFRALTGRPVSQGRFEAMDESTFQHIELAERADAMLIAPATANVMAKIAHGLADDIVTATVLAYRGPLLLAPAMNVGMWSSPATQANVEQLKARDVQVLDVGEGELACGAVGAGRLSPPLDIVDAVACTLGV